MLIKTMGFALFLVGLVLIVVATFVIFGSFNMLGGFERWAVFGSGIVLCVIGYFMARGEEELSSVSKEVEGEPPLGLDEVSHRLS
jgi:hypothetical protein